MILRSSSADFACLQLALEPIERVKAADRHVEDRLHALLTKSIDDVRRNAGIDRGLHRRAVGLVDEHGDGPPREARHLEHLLERVAARILEIDEDDVGIDGADARQQVGHVPDVVNLRRAAILAVVRQAQAFLEDGCAHRVLVDY